MAVCAFHMCLSSKDHGKTSDRQRRLLNQRSFPTPQSAWAFWRLGGARPSEVLTCSKKTAAASEGVAGPVSDHVSVLLGCAGGGFGAAKSFPAGDGTVSVAVGDFNGDRDPDLAVDDFCEHVLVLLNSTHACGERLPTLVARPRAGALRGTPEADVIVGSRKRT